MTKFSFSGHSDDVFEAAQNGRGIEECYPPQRYRITSPDGAVEITADYDGVWAIGIRPVDEDARIPEWPVQMSLAHNGYSAELTITAPEGSTLSIIKGEE